jgi:hypothetical protein
LVLDLLLLLLLLLMSETVAEQEQPGLQALRMMMVVPIVETEFVPVFAPMASLAVQPGIFV